MQLRFPPGERLGARSWVWQLMFFIVACCTVLIAFQAFHQPQATTRVESPEETLAPDFVSPVRNDLADDEFRAPPPDLASETPPRPRRNNEPVTPPNRQLRTDLSLVRDNTLGVRYDESTAFFDLLQETRRRPEEIDARVRHDVQYANLMADPAAYRGQAVALAGELWRLTPFKATRNSHGLETLYEAWIVTPDSAPHAYRVVASQLGADLQPGIQSRVPIFVTGYFLKREGYATPQGVEVAPTIVAARLDWDDTVPHPGAMAAFPPWMMGLIVAGGLILTATLVSLTLSERRSARQQPRYEPMRAETLTALAALPPYSIGNVLLELEEQDRVRQFEGVRPPHIKPTPLWTKNETRAASHRSTGAIDLPTPTPPTRQFRRGWKERWTGEKPPSDTNGE